ncbi:efflux RND transporter periplasmic adaptor subunit [Crenothrix sp.]|uniref:efflux RND transporter periplasmic adaptor subunit n=1 Tax=Crenothrix sp. TaxID=3100433 RepID=UPI00374CC071
MSDRLNHQLLRLTLLLQLERRARLAPADELPFVIVNETTELLPYRQAILWQKDQAKLEAASGVAKPEKNSPYALWLKPVLQHITCDPRAASVMGFTAEDVPEELAKDWYEWLPEHALWIPLITPSASKYGLVLFRDNAWTEAETQLVGYLAETYGHALALAEAGPPQRSWLDRLHSRKIQLLIAAVLLAAACYPVRQAVLAEAEVIPIKPNLVRAPLEGVVETFYVQPNEEVKLGQKLFSLDTTQLRSRLEVAEETRDIAKTEYLQTTQQAMLDPTVKSKLAGLKSEWDQQVAEVDYVRTLLKRSVVTATRSGVTVFDDPNDWLGKPVTQGEKILAVADPAVVELEVRLPMDDLIALESGAEVLFFSNINPHKPLHASLNYFSYRATPTPADIMAYRLKATFTGHDTLPRLGYRGSAKLYGTRKPFILWLFRKPIQTVRLWLTW